MRNGDYNINEKYSEDKQRIVPALLNLGSNFTINLAKKFENTTNTAYRLI